jgi:hypothetical protein
VDVERTIEFILKTQAETDARLRGITKLVQQGMRLLVKNETTVAQIAAAQKRTDAKLAQLAERTDAKFAEMADAHKELAREMKELAKAQKETERTLRAFIRGQRNGRNGR